MLKVGDILIAKEDITMYEELAFIKGKSYRVNEISVINLPNDKYYFLKTDCEWMKDMSISFGALNKFDILREVRREKLQKIDESNM